MAQQTICDRCKAVTVYPESRGDMESKELKEYWNNEPFLGFYNNLGTYLSDCGKKDLCEACRNSLKAWFAPIQQLPL